jgi:DNA-directed RNA polymerase specialized sigma24 family protein
MPFHPNSTPNTRQPSSEKPGPSDSFLEVMDGLDRHDEDAARIVYEKFIDSIVRLARKKLDPALGAKVNADSVAQEAMASFFFGRGKKKYIIDGWPALYGFLARITHRKALNRNRYHHQVKRNDRLDSAGNERLPVVSLEEYQAASRDPGPAEEAEINDMVESVLNQFKPSHRGILEIFLQTKSKEQAVFGSGYSTRTVERVIEDFRERILLLDREDEEK